MKVQNRTVNCFFAVVLTIFCAASICFSAEESRARARFGSRRAPVVSPQVLEDGRITFRIRAPKAESVRLAGGDIPGIRRQSGELKKEEGDVWKVTVGPVIPGAFRYRFNVDGVDVMDPRNPATSESNNNTWSLVCVPGSEFFDTKDVPHGAVSEVAYYSNSLKRFRRMHIYTPPGYQKGKGKFPVFYLLHGASDSDNSWSSVGRAGFILDNLIAAGKAKPMVVVMPAGHTGPFGFGRPRRGGVDEFTQDFLNDIMPYMETNYRIIADQGHRAIAGLSMGGAQTLNIAVPNLDKFAYFGVFSSGVFSMGRRGSGGRSGPSWEEQQKKFLDDAELKKKLKLVWFATGKEDFLIETSRATVAMLKKHGLKVDYKETSGGHTWINWRQYLVDFSTKLFQE